MKIFIPHKKDANIYLEEIISYSSNLFIYGTFEDYDNSFEIVNIQFPEAIFGFCAPPSSNQLVQLEMNLKKWKKYSKIVYTMNDVVKHYDENNQFLDLFRLIHQYADGVIHLGRYSLTNYKSLFKSDCQHTVIYHPLYTSLVKIKDNANIQELIPIDLKDKFVVSVFGKIRSKEEFELVLKAYRKIPVKNKVLIVPRLYEFVRFTNRIPTLFREKYKRLMERILCFPMLKGQFYFSYNYIEYNYLVNLVEHSSIILIPRIRNLNSGNLFLGLTFNKPMMIPKIGNLSEVAEFLNLPLLNITENNFEEVFQKLILLSNNGYFYSKDFESKKNNFHPKKIANDYDVFFEKLIKQ